MNKFSGDKVNPDELNQLRLDLGINVGEYVLSYLGSLGTWYLLGEMLDFYKVLLCTRPNARLLIVTNDPQEAILPALQLRAIDVRQVIIVRAPFDRVPYYIALSNASIFFIKQAYSKKGSSPVKQGELMSMGVPVVCNDQVGDTGWIVQQYQSGVVVGAFNDIAYQDAVEALLRNEFDPKAIRVGANEYFSLEMGVKRYASVYERVVNMK
jgi:glycosyltransferase involved in cell wall biosynthesis